MLDKSKLARSLNASLVPDDLLGTWTNELQSVMNITQTSRQAFNGTYVSAVSADGTTVSGVLSGTVAQDTIAFNVNWQPTYDSVTSWTGLILTDEDGTRCIYALWQLAEGADPGKGWWQAINAGADLFVQQQDA